MAKSKELVKRRKGVRNTKKITRTMELISTAKLKKLSNIMLRSRPYSQELFSLVQQLLQAGVSLELAEERTKVKKVLVLAMASNRGLCGAYNVKVVEGIQKLCQEHTALGREVFPYVIGKRAITMLSYSGFHVEKEFRDIDDRTPFAEVQKLARHFMNLFSKGEVDEIHIAYTAFHSRSRQDLVIERLLPISRPKQEEGKKEAGGFLFEPSPEAVLSELAPLAVENNLYRMFMEAMTSEQAYRMRAMKNATDNAESMIKELSRLYNRARQTQITMELLDILGGVEAI